MRVLCNTRTLSEACQNVQRAVSTKSSIPAIEGILISADSNGLKLSGYDLEVGITTSIDADVKEEGSIILNAKLLCDILRRLPGDKVDLSSDERNTSTIISGAAEYSLIGISSDEYPELPSVTGGSPAMLSHGMLKNMIKQTIFSVAVNDAKPIHNGIKFEIGFGQIRLVAVDGYRLAMRTESINYDGESLSFVAPSKTLNEVMRLTDDSEESQVAMGVGKRHISFNINNYCVVSRLLDGEFLDYRSSIPPTSSTSVKVNARLMTETVERTSLIITDRLKSPLRCIFSEDSIKTSCITAIGKAMDCLEAEIDGPRVEIGFNNRYILDALHASDTDEVRIELNGPLSPIKILPPEGEAFLFLILPVRLKNEDPSV